MPTSSSSFYKQQRSQQLRESFKERGFEAYPNTPVTRQEAQEVADLYVSYFELNYPIKVRFTNRFATRRIGFYSFRNGGHYIGLSISGENIHTLLHEISHAIQYDKYRASCQAYIERRKNGEDTAGIYYPSSSSPHGPEFKSIRKKVFHLWYLPEKEGYK